MGMLSISNQKQRNAISTLQIAMQKGTSGEIQQAWEGFHQSIVDTVEENIKEEMESLIGVEAKMEKGNFAKYKNNADFFNKVFKGEGEKCTVEQFAKGVIFNEWGDKAPMQRVDGGILAPVSVLSDIIYEAMNKSVLLKYCPIINMDEGKVIVGKVNENVSLDFKEKYKAGLETNLGLEGVELNAKTLYGYVYISEEDLQDVQNLDSILTRAFSEAVAQILDENFLYTNTKELERKETLNSNSTPIYPKGILDYENICKVEVAEVDYDMILDGLLEIEKKNGSASVVALNPVEGYKLQKLKDSNGQYIKPPEAINNLSKEQSNGLKENDVLVFDPSQVLIGLRSAMDVKMMPILENGVYVMRVMVRADVVPVREEHICKITVNKPTLMTKGKK